MSGTSRSQAEDVGVTLDGENVLQGISLQLEAGSVVGVAGPNGAGKTTLARVLAGFLEPTRGRATIDGEPARLVRVSRGVGYLPEESPDVWDWTTRELLRARGTRSGESLDVHRLLELLAESVPVDRRLDRVSKGQRRLALAAYAMAGPPPLIILDEPDTGLDPAAQRHLRELVRCCAREGALVLLLSHRLEQLERSCDRLLFLGRGAVVGSFAAAEIGARGADAIYRELIG